MTPNSDNAIRVDDIVAPSLGTSRISTNTGEVSEETDMGRCLRVGLDRQDVALRDLFPEVLDREKDLQVLAGRGDPGPPQGVGQWRRFGDQFFGGLHRGLSRSVQGEPRTVAPRHDSGDESVRFLRALGLIAAAGDKVEDRRATGARLNAIAQRDRGWQRRSGGLAEQDLGGMLVGDQRAVSQCDVLRASAKGAADVMDPQQLAHVTQGDHADRAGRTLKLEDQAAVPYPQGPPELFKQKIK